ncbi:hypothetical protein T11_2910, partial [Trichinella zimbabwensis]
LTRQRQHSTQSNYCGNGYTASRWNLHLRQQIQKELANSKGNRTSKSRSMHIPHFPGIFNADTESHVGNELLQRTPHDFYIVLALQPRWGQNNKPIICKKHGFTIPVYHTSYYLINHYKSLYHKLIKLNN